MSEESSGAEILSEAPEATAETPEVTTPQVSSNDTSWMEGISEEYRGTMEARGLSDTDTLAKSYHNLVKLHGNNPNVVALPGADASDEDRASFYKSIGRPDEASQYEMDTPDGMPVDEAFYGGYKDAAFELGLTADQAKGIANWYNGQASGEMESQSQSALVQADQDIASLRGEWGQGYDGKMAEGRAAVNMLGIEDQMLNQLEMAMGTGTMLKFFQNIGSKIGEDVAIGGGDEQFNGGMTPSQATSELEALTDDFKTSLIDPRHSQHKANTERWKSLNRYKNG